MLGRRPREPGAILPARVCFKTFVESFVANVFWQFCRLEAIKDSTKGSTKVLEKVSDEGRFA